MAAATEVSAEPIIENADVLRPKKYEYQITVGTDLEPEVVCECGTCWRADECPKCGKNGRPQLAQVLGPQNQPVTRDGRPVMRVVTKDVMYGPRRERGDVFRSNRRREDHNVKGQPARYVLLDKDHNPLVAPLAAEKQRADRLAVERKKLLEAMTREQLQAYADSENVPLNGAVKREAILKVLLGAEPQAA